MVQCQRLSHWFERRESITTSYLSGKTTASVGKTQSFSWHKGLIPPCHPLVSHHFPIFSLSNSHLGGATFSGTNRYQPHICQACSGWIHAHFDQNLLIIFRVNGHIEVANEPCLWASGCQGYILENLGKRMIDVNPGLELHWAVHPWDTTF